MCHAGTTRTERPDSVNHGWAQISDKKVIPMRFASREAEAWFWWARRQLRIRDLDVYPQVDYVLKKELELYSLAENTVSLKRVRARLNIP